MSRSHGDLSAKILGLFVLLAGIAVLLFVFFTALHLFQGPVAGLDLPSAKGSPGPNASSIGVALLGLVYKLLLLTVMIVAGSSIASKGVQLYFSSASVPNHAVAHPVVTTTPSHQPEIDQPNTPDV